MTLNRTEAPGAGLSAAFERLSIHSTEWSSERVLDEGLDLLRDCSWADASMLYSVRPDAALELCRRPHSPWPTPTELPTDWFPWGLAPVSPQRFLLVEDARILPIAPGSTETLGSIGISSCLHLPILERSVAVGAMHLYWTEPRLNWDDERGRLLRSLGRFLLARAGATPCLGEP